MSEDEFLAHVVRWQPVVALRQASNLVAHVDVEEVLGFADLAVRTVRRLPPVERMIVPLNPRVPLAASLLEMVDARLPDLAPEWRGWVDRHDELVARNPRLALADRLSAIDRALDDGGGPVAFTPAFRRAIDGDGATAAWPVLRRLAARFDETPFPELRRMRAAAGGWVVRDEVANVRLFVPEERPDVGGEPYV